MEPETFAKWGTIIAVAIVILFLWIPAAIRGARQGRELRERKHRWNVHPISTVCPSCGAGEYRRIDADTPVSFQYDRECKNCGTRYTPPTPRWAGKVFCILSVIGFVAMVVLVVLRFMGTWDRVPAFRNFSLYFLLAGILGLSATCWSYGVWVLRRQGDCDTEGREVQPERWAGDEDRKE